MPSQGHYIPIRWTVPLPLSEHFFFLCLSAAILAFCPRLLIFCTLRSTVPVLWGRRPWSVNCLGPPWPQGNLPYEPTYQFPADCTWTSNSSCLFPRLHVFASRLIRWVLSCAATKVWELPRRVVPWVFSHWSLYWGFSPSFGRHRRTT